MGKLWINGNKLVTADNKVIECDECPCVCCSPDYVIVQDMNGFNENMRGTFVLPKWDGVPKPSPFPWLTYDWSMPYPVISYWLYNANVCQYVACTRDGVYQEVWDDGYHVGPQYNSWVIGNLCNEINGMYSCKIIPVFL